MSHRHFLQRKMGVWLAGRTGRKLETILAGIRRCANDIHRLSGTPAGLSALALAEKEETILSAGDYWKLPEKRLVFADLFEKAAPHHSSRNHPIRNQAKAQLCAYVKIRTGREYDAEVSGLISSVLDNPNYSPQTHKDRRTKNAELIERLRPYAANFSLFHR